MWKYIKIVIGLIIIFILLDIYKCPINYFFGIDCPGCNMTSAYKALLRLDFVSAFKHHYLFPIPLIVVIYQLFRKKLNIGKKNEMIALLAIVAMFIIRWIILFF